jgi:hypothetical protein
MSLAFSPGVPWRWHTELRPCVLPREDPAGGTVTVLLAVAPLLFVTAARGGVAASRSVRSAVSVQPRRPPLEGRSWTRMRYMTTVLCPSVHTAGRTQIAAFSSALADPTKARSLSAGTRRPSHVCTRRSSRRPSVPPPRRAGRHAARAGISVTSVAVHRNVTNARRWRWRRSHAARAH